MKHAMWRRNQCAGEPYDRVFERHADSGLESGLTYPRGARWAVKMNWRGEPHRACVICETTVRVTQFWNSQPPTEVVALMETWRTDEALQPYNLWDDDAAGAFIGSQFGSRTLAAYRKCAVAAMKADFFRYCALHEFGGLYVDADVANRGGLQGLLATVDRALLFRRQVPIANDLMYFAQSRDPIMATAIETAVSNIEGRISNNVWAVTGPGILTRLQRRDPSLFEHVTWKTVGQMKQYVQFNWSLDYKKSSSHWTLHQQAGSIFTASNVTPNIDDERSV